MTTASTDVMGLMDSQAFQALRVTASKGPQVTQVTKDHLARRAFQEKGVPRDWACQAPKAILVFPEMMDYLDHQASPVLLVTQAFQDK